MRFQGVIVKWFDEKGYGFIKINDVAEQIFAHMSAFPTAQSKPKLNELVTFEIAEGAKGQQAYNVQYVNRARHVIKPVRYETPKSKKNYSGLIIMAMFGFLILNLMSPKNPSIKPSGSDVAQPHVSADHQNFQCRGKSKCSEMVSCDEAVYYLKHCPGTVMDSDGDGMPCEDQWCGH